MRARSEIVSVSEAWPKDSEFGVSDIRITAVAGGNDRIESVQLALKYSGDADIVLVHDAARAMTPPSVFQRVVAAVRAGAEAVVPVLPMTDTVRRAETRQADADGWQVVVDSGAEIDQNLPTVEVLHGDLDRSRLRRVQTPQGFAASSLRRAHEKYEDNLATAGPGALTATDDAGLVERLGVDVVSVDGDEAALKITYPLDLVLGEHIAKMRDEEISAAANRGAAGSTLNERGQRR